jgi:hypothetical protein
MTQYHSLNLHLNNKFVITIKHNDNSTNSNRSIELQIYATRKWSLWFLWNFLHNFEVRVTHNCYCTLNVQCVDQKSTIFWDITPCSPLEVNRLFGGTYRLHLQGRRISRARNQSKIRWQGRRYIPPKRRFTFNGLHGVISQKIVLFITTAVRTSNPT